jgi:hypothetical protein
VKRLIAIIDGLAVSFAGLFAVGVVCAVLRALFIAFSRTNPETNPDFLHNFLITLRQDVHELAEMGWSGLVIFMFILVWAAFRWKSGIEAIGNMTRGSDS